MAFKQVFFDYQGGCVSWQAGITEVVLNELGKTTYAVVPISLVK